MTYQWYLDKEIIMELEDLKLCFENGFKKCHQIESEQSVNRILSKGLEVLR